MHNDDDDDNNNNNSNNNNDDDDDGDGDDDDDDDDENCTICMITGTLLKQSHKVYGIFTLEIVECIAQSSTKVLLNTHSEKKCS